MSQHKLIDSEGREWMVGYDNPSRGYFATRFLSDEEAERTGKEADVLIGFGKGVKITELIVYTEAEGLRLNDYIIEQLEDDYRREHRPLSPLQKQMQEIMAELGVFD